MPDLVSEKIAMDARWDDMPGYRGHSWSAGVGRHIAMLMRGHYAVMTSIHSARYSVLTCSLSLSSSDCYVNSTVVMSHSGSSSSVCLPSSVCSSTRVLSTSTRYNPYNGVNCEVLEEVKGRTFSLDVISSQRETYDEISRL